MQSLIDPAGLPEPGLIRFEITHFGIICLGPVNVKVRHPFSANNGQRQAGVHANQQQRESGAKRMNACMNSPPKVQVFARKIAGQQE